MTNALLLIAMLAGPRPDLAVKPHASQGAHETALRDEIGRLEQRTFAERNDVAAWKQLATAWRRLARLTGDSSCDDKAWEALRSALEADPRDQEARALKGWVQAARHDFEGAVVSARESVALRPDDWWSYGVLADALTELGRYGEAVQAVEAMMRMRPGIGAYTRAAHLRSLHGDSAGAIALMRMAIEAASPADAEGMAWTLVMLGREHQSAGDHDAARVQYRRALELVPSYHLALFHLGESQAMTGEIDAAIETLERLHVVSPSVVSAASLGDLHLAAGRKGRASAFYRDVDAIAALADPSKAEPRWLARFYADRGEKLEKSIELVRAELATHQDVATWDGFAWALHRAGHHAAALEASKKALALGTRDARLLYHRGMIDIAIGRTDEARSRLEEALRLRNLWPQEKAAAERALARAR